MNLRKMRIWTLLDKRPASILSRRYTYRVLPYSVSEGKKKIIQEQLIEMFNLLYAMQTDASEVDIVAVLYQPGDVKSQLKIEHILR